MFVCTCASVCVRGEMRDASSDSVPPGQMHAHTHTHTSRGAGAAAG